MAQSTAEKTRTVEEAWDIAHEENATFDRDKTRKETVVNYVDGLICDMATPGFERQESKSDFLDLVSRIKSALYCYEQNVKESK